MLLPTPLPADRLKVSPPLPVTDVNFTLCITLKNKKKRIGEAYICLFTSAIGRTVYLEIVQYLTEKTVI